MGLSTACVRASLRRLLDGIAAPALVRNRRLLYLAANAPGRALLCEMFKAAQPKVGSTTRLAGITPPLGQSRFRTSNGVRASNELVACTRERAGCGPPPSDA